MVAILQHPDRFGLVRYGTMLPRLLWLSGIQDLQIVHVSARTKQEQSFSSIGKTDVREALPFGLWKTPNGLWTRVAEV
jgi:hypothetical protein